jgi:hypothetical protein
MITIAELTAVRPLHTRLRMLRKHLARRIEMT